VTAPAQGFEVGYVLDLYPELSQTFVANEIDELRRLGVTVHVLALHRGDREPRPDEPFIHLAAVPARRMRDYLDFARVLWWRPVRLVRFLSRLRRTHDVPFVRKLGRIARQLQPANVQRLHVHFAWQGADVAALLAALLGIPWSVTVHARDLFTQDVDVLRRRLRTARQVVCISEFNQRWLLEHGIDRGSTVVRCGVRIPEHPELSAPDHDVAVVARLVEKKGVDVLIAALGVLAERSVRPSVVVVGDGPERVHLEDRADRVGVRQQLHFLGAQPHAQALATIRSARVVCLPSRMAGDGDMDGVPISLMEAMAHGKPVVASAISGIPELVDDSCGRLVPPDDPAALAAALDTLLADEELRRRLGAAARTRVATSYSLDGEVRRLLATLSR
jgi:colanic acid/amylovoran biosynthesis glycosyltransferase